MTKLLYLALSLVAFTSLLTGYALADVAPGSIILMPILMIVFVAAIIVTIVVLIVRLIQNHRKK